ncbi:MAG: hypothetical protein HYU75_24610 [Betaproteobacteria bacterium]|nr:hypothetical protein [Betaproteobacteria bacterium]
MSAAFTPTAEGDLPGWLVIDTNAPGPPSIVTLSGTGTPGTATTTTTTSTAATTTTTSSTTTTTVGGTGGSATLNFVTGWNLTGNSSSEALDIAAAFGDTGKVNTVWKWVPGTTRWAFYAPSLAAQQLSDYAASKGYDVLSSISGGEGFWVNAKSAFSASVAGGTPVETTTFQTDAATGQSKLVTGWNLIAIGDNKTPSQFNASIGATSPAAGQIPINVTTLWAWDANLANWYFYAPSLEEKGGTVLADYITSKNYLNFGANTLGPTTGFWVNKP